MPDRCEWLEKNAGLYSERRVKAQVKKWRCRGGSALRAVRGGIFMIDDKDLSESRLRFVLWKDLQGYSDKELFDFLGMMMLL